MVHLLNFPQLQVLGHKAGIDGKTTGATLITTTENGVRRFYATAVLFELTAVAVLIGVCTASVGTNGATYNNLLAATALTGVSVVNNMLRLPIGAVAVSSVAPNTDVYINITIGATATTYTIRAVVEGFYL
jgi:hypothetical protein